MRIKNDSNSCRLNSHPIYDFTTVYWDHPFERKFELSFSIFKYFLLDELCRIKLPSTYMSKCHHRPKAVNRIQQPISNQVYQVKHIHQFSLESRNNVHNAKFPEISLSKAQKYTRSERHRANICLTVLCFTQ